MPNSTIGTTTSGIVGASGEWSVQDERPDPSIVVQSGDEFCFAACVSTILRGRGIIVMQRTIASEVGIPTPWSDTMTATLNEHDSDRVWSRKWFNPNDLAKAWKYLGRRVPWIALFKDYGNPLHHAIIVHGLDGQGRWKIRDPWKPGTAYFMLPAAVADLQHGWTGYAIYPLRRRTR
jgi:hypothetical protein